MGSCRRRLLRAAARRASPLVRQSAVLPADCDWHRRLPLTLPTSAVGEDGKAPDARIRTRRAFPRPRPDCRQNLFEGELNLDPPRLAHGAETPKPVGPRQGPPDRKPDPRQVPSAQLALAARVPDPERSPGRLPNTDTEGAVRAPGPKTREPRFPSRLHPRKEALNRPVQAHQRRAGHLRRCPLPLGIPFPEGGQRREPVIEGDAPSRHVLGMDAHFERGVVGYGEMPVRQAIARRGEHCRMAERLHGHAEFPPMCPARACRRKNSGAFRESVLRGGPDTNKSKYSIL